MCPVCRKVFYNADTSAETCGADCQRVYDNIKHLQWMKGELPQRAHFRRLIWFFAFFSPAATPAGGRRCLSARSPTCASSPRRLGKTHAVRRAERVPGLVEPREAAAAELRSPPLRTAATAPKRCSPAPPRRWTRARRARCAGSTPLLGDELADGAIAARIEELLGLELPVIGSVAAREKCPNPELYDRILSRLGADEGHAPARHGRP